MIDINTIKNVYKDKQPTLADYPRNDDFEIDIINAVILYRLITDSCMVGSLFILEIADENKKVTIKEIINKAKERKAFKWDVFENYFLNSQTFAISTNE